MLRFFLNRVFPVHWHWWACPVLWVVAAGIPTILGGRSRQDLGLHLTRIGFSLKILAITCLMIFPVTYVGLYLLKLLGLAWEPLSGIPPDAWLFWLLYQFLYVAVAEELFFRGYILGLLLRFRTNLSLRRPGVWQGMSILISALVFALFHVMQGGGVVSVLTFFPALVLGWLLVRTRSLVAPILFHGLANTFYALVATLLS